MHRGAGAGVESVEPRGRCRRQQPRRLIAPTSRRWFKSQTTIDPNKLIYWMHPNFAPTVLRELDRQFHRQHLCFWPLRIPLVDINLVARFVDVRP